jgi:hypothetical protein
VRYCWLTEHYSSIAVYQLSKENVAAESTSKSNNNGSNKSANQGLWKIAMRVKNNCEGPFASKLKTAGEADDATSTCPAVACPLVNGNVYHMLDEFNHHHQHCGKCGFRQPCQCSPSKFDFVSAVLPGNALRYSSTHRVCRLDGHTFPSIRLRCLNALQVWFSTRVSVKLSFCDDVVLVTGVWV